MSLEFALCAIILVWCVAMLVWVARERADLERSEAEHRRRRDAGLARIRALVNAGQVDITAQPTEPNGPGKGDSDAPEADV